MEPQANAQGSDRPRSTALGTGLIRVAFKPEERRSIDEVWGNPLGFVVREYAITSDRLEEG